MHDLLARITKSGVKTSEFWIALAALLLPYVLQIPQDQATTWAAAHGGAWAGYIVATAYILGRAYMKGKQVQTLGEPALADAQTQAVLQQFGPDVIPLGAELRRQLQIARAAAAQRITDPAVLQKIVEDIAAASPVVPGATLR